MYLAFKQKKKSTRSSCKSSGVNLHKMSHFASTRIFTFFFLLLSIFIIRDCSSKPKKATEYFGDGGWLRLCTKTKGKDGNIVGLVKADHCSQGYWFKEAVKVGCACGHGVWVFSKGWCDKGTRVIAAYNGSCFAVDKDVRYLRFIGNPYRAFMPYHFQSTSGFEYVQELPSSFDEYSYFSRSYDQHLGAIFPVNEIESENSRRCLEYNVTAKSAMGMKYYAERLPYRQTPFCSKSRGLKSNFTYDDLIQVDQFFGLREKGKDPTKPVGPPSTWKAKDSRCSSECAGHVTIVAAGLKSVNGSNSSEPAAVVATTPAPEVTTEDLLPPDYLDPLKDEYLIIEEINYTEPPIKAKVAGAGNDSANATAGGNSTSVSNLKKTRMRLEFPNLSHKNAFDCDSSSPTYTLSPKILREINEQTRKMALGNLAFSLKGLTSPKVNTEEYLMFQIARNIVMKVCPEDEVPGSLISGLMRMFRVVLKESFKFYPPSERADANKTAKIVDKLKVCLESAKPFVFNYENNTDPNADCPTAFRDVTFTYSGDKHSNRTLLADVPKELETDLQQLDLPVETAWKTVMLSHYYCSRHFQNDSVTDYSYFYELMEMFFNRWIQHRWYYPGPAYDVYKFMFQMYDLKKFATNLDRCVGASRSFSNYKKWIKRPIYVKHCGGATFQSMDDKNSKSGGGRKQKLDPISPELTEFGNKAYCLPFWHSPVSNPGINYDPSKDGAAEGCVQYKPSDDTDGSGLGVEWRNSIF